MSQGNNILVKHPVLSGTLIFLIIFISLDLLLGMVIIPPDYHAFRRRHPYYHHGIEPMRSEITNWGLIFYPFHSNSLGFRDGSRRVVALESDKRRILFLGDSHTEAVGVSYENSFAGRLAAYAADLNIEVLNAAAVSYSPKLHYLKIKHLIEKEGLEVDEILLLIDMSDLNNEIAYEHFQPKQRSKTYHFLNRIARDISSRSMSAYLVAQIMKKQRNKRFNKNIQTQAEGNFELYATFFDEFDNIELISDPNFHNVSQWLYDEEFRELARYSLEQAQDNLARLVALCEQHEIEVSLSVHPWQDQILEGDTTNLYVDSWRAFSEDHDIRFINLFPVFINSKNPVMVAKQNYIKEDNHWNEHGHRLVFEELKKYIFE